MPIGRVPAALNPRVCAPSVVQNVVEKATTGRRSAHPLASRPRLRRVHRSVLGEPLLTHQPRGTASTLRRTAGDSQVRRQRGRRCRCRDDQVAWVLLGTVESAKRLCHCLPVPTCAVMHTFVGAWRCRLALCPRRLPPNRHAAAIDDESRRIRRGDGRRRRTSIRVRHDRVEADSPS